MNKPAAVPEEALERAIARDIPQEVNEKEARPEYSPVVYFCKDCRKIVQSPKALSRNKNLTFCCPECNGKNVAWGTEVSIRNFYKVDESGQGEERTKKASSDQVARLKEKKEDLKEKKEEKKKAA